MTTDHDHEHDHPHETGQHHHHKHGPHPHENTPTHHPLEDVVPKPEPEPEPTPSPGKPTAVEVPDAATRVTDSKQLTEALADRAKVLDLDGEFLIAGQRGLAVPAGTQLYISSRSDVRPATSNVGAAFNCQKGSEALSDILITGYDGLAQIHGFFGFLDTSGRPTGRGIIAGQSSTYQNLDIYDCAENGIAGGPANHTKILHCWLHDNGHEDTMGHAAAGMKLANAEDLEVGYVLAESNLGNGLWLDVRMRSAWFHNCAAIMNTRKGYHYEISYGPALYEDCYAAENGWPEGREKSDGGFIVVSSTNVTYKGCISHHNVGGNGFAAREDSRPPALANITVEDDCQTTGGDTIKIERN